MTTSTDPRAAAGDVRASIHHLADVTRHGNFGDLACVHDVLAELTTALAGLHPIIRQAQDLAHHDEDWPDTVPQWARDLDPAIASARKLVFDLDAARTTTATQ